MLLIHSLAHVHTHVHTYLHGDPVLEGHVDVGVRMEGAKGAQLGKLQEQHWLGARAHCNHAHDVGVFKLTQDGHLHTNIHTYIHTYVHTYHTFVYDVCTVYI